MRHAHTTGMGVAPLVSREEARDPLAPHRWAQTRARGVRFCLHCGSSACCPRCRGDLLPRLRVGTWIIICPPCGRVLEEQHVTTAIEEVLAP